MAIDLSDLQFTINVDTGDTTQEISKLTKLVKKLDDAMKGMSTSTSTKRTGVFSMFETRDVRGYDSFFKRVSDHTKHIQRMKDNLGQVNKAAKDLSQTYGTLSGEVVKFVEYTDSVGKSKSAITEINNRYKSLQQQLTLVNAKYAEMKILAAENVASLNAITKASEKDSPIRAKAKRDLIEQGEEYRRQLKTLEHQKLIMTEAMKTAKQAHTEATQMSKTLGDNFNRFAGEVMSVGRGFMQIGRTLSRYITTPIMALAIWGVKFTAELEVQQRLFDILLGDLEASERLYRNLIEYSAATPYQLKNTTAAVKELLAFGSTESDVMEELRMLGDIAQNDAQKLDAVTQAFGKVQARGVAHMRELNRFIMAGVPIMESLRKVTNKTSQELFDAVQKGKISFGAVKRALEDMTSEGGKFYNISAELAKTLSGQFSILRDVFDLTAKSFVEDFTPYIVEAIKFLVDFMNELRFGTEDVRKKWVKVLGVLAGIGPVMLMFGVFANLLGTSIKLVSQLAQGARALFSVLTQGINSVTAASVVNPLLFVLTVISAIVGALVAWNLKTKIQDAVQLRREFNLIGEKMEAGALSIDEAFLSLDRRLNTADLIMPAVTFEQVQKYVEDNGWEGIVPYFEKQREAILEYQTELSAVGRDIYKDFKENNAVLDVFATKLSEIWEQSGVDIEALAKKYNVSLQSGVEAAGVNLGPTRGQWTAAAFGYDTIEKESYLVVREILNKIFGAKALDAAAIQEIISELGGGFFDVFGEVYGERLAKSYSTIPSIAASALDEKLTVYSWGGVENKLLIALGKGLSIGNKLDPILKTVQTENTPLLEAVDKVYDAYFENVISVSEDNVERFLKILHDLDFAGELSEALQNAFTPTGNEAYNQRKLVGLFTKDYGIGNQFYSGLSERGKKIYDTLGQAFIKGFTKGEISYAQILEVFDTLGAKISDASKSLIASFEQDYYINNVGTVLTAKLQEGLTEASWEIKGAQAEAVMGGINRLLSEYLESETITTFKEFNDAVDEFFKKNADFKKAYDEYFEIKKDADADKVYQAEIKNLNETITLYGLYGKALHEATAALKGFNEEQTKDYVAKQLTVEGLNAINSLLGSVAVLPSSDDVLKALAIVPSSLTEGQLPNVLAQQKQVVQGWYRDIFALDPVVMSKFMKSTEYTQVEEAIMGLFGDTSQFKQSGVRAGLTTQLGETERAIKILGKSATEVFEMDMLDKIATLGLGESNALLDYLDLVIAKMKELEELTFWEDFKNTLTSTMWTAGLTPIVEGFEQIGEAMAGAANWGDTFAGILRGLVDSILEALPQMLLQAGLQAIIADVYDWRGWALLGASAMGYLIKGYSQSYGQDAETTGYMAPSTLTFNAKGNAYSMGKVISAKTAFRTSTGTTIGGEAGPEALMPLARGLDGRLGVIAHGGASGGVVVPVSINVVNETGTPIDTDMTESTGPNGEKQITMYIKKAVSEGIGSGEYDRILGARYGIKNRGVV